MDEKILGIDLGNSDSVACVYVEGKPTFIPSAEGNAIYGKTFPSDVAAKYGTIIVGEPARTIRTLGNPDNAISEIKRYIGTDYTVNLNGKDYTPQEISAMILQKIKRDAESFLGESITKVVITVPAYFNDKQRTATFDAGNIAGFEVLNIINDSTAACVAYLDDIRDNENINILVFDLGGCTLDVTVINSNGLYFEILSTSGNSNLGGKDMDDVLIKHFFDVAEKKYGIDVTHDLPAYRRLIVNALRTKIELSFMTETRVILPFISINDNGIPFDFDETLSRSKLEELVRPIVEKCGPCIDQAIEEAGLTIDEIDKVILVGGPTRMPIIQDYVENYTGKLVEMDIDPMECVAMGACIYGSRLNDSYEWGVDCVPMSIGYVERDITVCLIKKLTKVPFKVTRVFTTDYDNQTELEIELVQGESLLAEFNTSIGSFVLSGISPAPKGMEKIEVTFEVDVDGILSVTALVMSTGKEQSITVSDVSKMTSEELIHAIQKAKEGEIEIQKRFMYAKIKYEADLQIYSAQRLIHDSLLKYKLDENKITIIERLIFELEDALASNNVLSIKLKTKKLYDVMEDIDLS